MQKTAIIGIGCAGYHGIKALRENGFKGEIHVYSDTDNPPANPMLTTYYVAGRIPSERRFPFGSLRSLEETYNVTLHTGVPVSHIRTADKCVVMPDGTEEKYDRILIATGARAVSPNLGQGSCGKSFLMRTIADSDALKETLDQDKIQTAIVVGASMVGIKVAELLHQRGIKVSMIDMADRLFPLAAMPQISRILEQDLTKRGVQLLSGRGIDHVEETELGISAWLTDGQCLKADILVLCIGTRANVELVANTEVVQGEPVQINRGIIVNNKMETNIPDIYAAGDCCEALNLQTGKTMIIGLWANAAEQGRIAGCCMAGKEETYFGSIPNNITHYFDQTFIGIGDPNLEGKTYSFSGPSGMVCCVVGESGLQCVNILGNYRTSGMIRDYLMHRIAGEKKPLSLEDEGLLRDEGIPEGFLSLLKEETAAVGCCEEYKEEKQK